MSKILIEYFGDNTQRKNIKVDRRKLGNKGATLIELDNYGVPVPPGFVISTDLFDIYTEIGNIDSIDFSFLEDALKKLELYAKGSFEENSDAPPLLVSVRSGSIMSMPGMMDTILNIGINDRNIAKLGPYIGEKAAYDSYRRLINMYSASVLKLDEAVFYDILSSFLSLERVSSASQLSVKSLKAITEEYKKVVLNRTGKPFPQTVRDQMLGAVTAVLSSWGGDRAVKYREINDIPANLGTAVTIQKMVFGNADEKSGTGIVFSRDPSTGIKELFGEFIFQGQGEDVVSGAHFTSPLTDSMAKKYSSSSTSMESIFPTQLLELKEVCNKLEAIYLDMQDIEFTIESGKLWILQSRRGKRSAEASIVIASDMHAEGLLRKDQAVMQIEAKSLERLLHPTLKKDNTAKCIGAGLAASPGAASGMIALSSAKAEMMSQHGKSIILVRDETSPEDIAGMVAAKGIVTRRGGMTSHAAVVARGIGKPCVCSIHDMKIDMANSSVTIGSHTLFEGDIISMDGASGQVFLGKVEMAQAEMNKSFSTIMNWASELSRLEVRANADTPKDIENAKELGAAGVGLCRTEHMFLEKDKLFCIRKLILSADQNESSDALNELLKFQRADFREIFKKALGLPVTIRLLDPPLHEFLPQTEADVENFISLSGMKSDFVKSKILTLREHNPMLGHRGCRIAMTSPEIYKMQARAIFLAINDLLEDGLSPEDFSLEIMIPLVVYEKELSICKDIVSGEFSSLANIHKRLNDINYKFGAMIEIARAALNADKLAPLVDFFSFGTNDLTQTTLGISRDDSSTFIPHYLKSGISEKDPFVSLDIEGVGQLISGAVKKARTVNDKIKLGVCGEHGGDCDSIKFFDSIGLDYVSCSPFRIPIAKVSAAKSKINQEEKIDG